MALKLWRIANEKVKKERKIWICGRFRLSLQSRLIGNTEPCRSIDADLAGCFNFNRYATNGHWTHVYVGVRWIVRIYFRLSGSITSHPAPRIFNKDKKEKHLAKSKIITNFKSTKQNAIQYKNIENLRKQGDL